MSILRPACYKKFAHIIDEIYELFEGGSEGLGKPKLQADTQEEMERFLTKTIREVLGPTTSFASPGDDGLAPLGPETDLFSYGVDSLQATRVRNVISKGLDLGNQQVSLGQNIVYEHPSIRQLAAYLHGLKEAGKASSEQSQQQNASRQSDEREAESAAAEKLMWDLVHKFSSRVVPPSAAAATSAMESSRQGRPSLGETVVLTGATGSLGAHILDQLTRQPGIARVICLSRASSDAESLVRLKASLQQRQRDLAPEAWSKIASFAADVNNSNRLGLSAETYALIAASVTAVIHNAWPVNFNLSLPSFEPHIGGVVNLVNLAQTSERELKPMVFFSSSVSTVQGGNRFDGSICPEEFMTEASTAAGIGYGRSKWVVEKTLEKAAKENQARVGVFRIGQLVGDTEK